MQEQLQEAYELQEELEARAGKGGGGGSNSDTAVLKLEFELKQLKRELEDGKAAHEAEKAKLREQVAQASKAAPAQSRCANLFSIA